MSNLLARTAQARDERVQDLHLLLPIPSWDETLVARFEVLSRKPIEEFGNKKQSLESNADFVIQACKALYIKDEQSELTGEKLDDPESPYHGYVRIEDDNGTSVRFDQTLAEKMGLPAADKLTAREVLVYCFKDNFVAINTMSIKLFRWMQNTDKKVADSLLGE